MANEIIATVADKDGDKSTTSIQVQEGATIAQLNAFAPVWATALNNIILGKILSVICRIPVSVASLTSNLGALTADVEHIGKFQFRVLGGDNKVQVNIPAIDEDVAGALSNDNLDQSAPEVAAFIAAMESGIAVTGGTIQPCDIGERNVAGVVFAREAFRNSGKRR